MISFDDFIKLTKEFFGEFPQNMGEGFEDNEIPLDDIEDTTPMPDSYQANADDLPF